MRMEENEMTVPMKNMKVITKSVLIDGEEFVLISLDSFTEGQKETFGDKIYGLISYDYIDENGCMTKALNGIQMCVEATPEKSIEEMKNRIKIRKWKEANPHASDTEIIQYVVKVCEGV